jgi:hypothetical protein
MVPKREATASLNFPVPSALMAGHPEAMGRVKHVPAVPNL